MKDWQKTFVSAFIAQVLSIVGLSFATPFLPFFVADLGVKDIGQQAFYAGLALGVTAITLGIFSPIWGILGDRFGRRKMVCRSMFGGAVVLLAMSLVRTVGQLIACRLFQGMFTGTVSASVALVASVVPEKRRGFALGMMQAAVFTGNSVGPLLGGFIADLVGYRASFRVGAVIISLGGFLVYKYTSENFRRADPKKDTPAPGFLAIMGMSGFLLGAAILFGVRFSNLITNPSFPLIVKDIIPDHPRLNSITGMLIALAGLSGAISAGLLGYLGDRWGHRRILSACCIAAAVASSGHFFVRTIGALFLARLLFGLSVAGMQPAANDMICGSVDRRFIGRAIGLATSLSMLGMLLGPILGGALAQSVGLRVPFLAAAASHIALAALISRVRIPEGTGRARPRATPAAGKPPREAPE